MKTNKVDLKTGKTTLEDIPSSELTWLPSADKIAAEALKMLRNHRNSLLLETDWTQSRDVTLTKDSEWKTYRQELRDITKKHKTMDSAKGNWPTKPE